MARLSVDQSGIGMNLAENLSRDYPQVQPESFTNSSKERWATDFEIPLQRKDVSLPKDREMVARPADEAKPPGRAASGLIPVIGEGYERCHPHVTVREGQRLERGPVVNFRPLAGDPLPARHLDHADPREVVDVELEDVLARLVIGSVPHDLHGHLIALAPEVVLEADA